MPAGGGLVNRYDIAPSPNGDYALVWDNEAPKTDTMPFPRRFFDRNYKPVEAQQVADWLNGRDQPLPNMVERFNDPDDPLCRI